jgi:hypothetical protein
MERERTNYLRLLGADHRALFEETVAQAPGFAFVVRSLAVKFLKPARMDDILAVTTEPKPVKGVSSASYHPQRRSLGRGPCPRRLRVRPRPILKRFANADHDERQTGDRD